MSAGVVCSKPDSTAAWEFACRHSAGWLHYWGPHRTLQLWRPQFHHLQSWHIAGMRTKNTAWSCSMHHVSMYLSWIWLPLTTSLAPHYSCTSPMDCISHHALHSHIPIHHYTNHTAVTIHSLALIVSPHLHLIHTHTFKQHSYMHSLRSLVLAPADISERLPFPLIATSVFDPRLPYLGTLNLCLWPRPLPGIVYVSALPLIFLLLPADHCLFDSA